MVTTVATARVATATTLREMLSAAILINSSKTGMMLASLSTAAGTTFSQIKSPTIMVPRVLPMCTAPSNNNKWDLRQLILRVNLGFLQEITIQKCIVRCLRQISLERIQSSSLRRSSEDFRQWWLIPLRRNLKVPLMMHAHLVQQIKVQVLLQPDRNPPSYLWLRASKYSC